MGHVVGKNTETVTLPFGYKFINTNGRIDENTDLYTTNSDANTKKSSYGAKVVNSIEADNTQDSFNVNTANKWIQIATYDDDENNKHTIKFAHEIHPFLTEENNSTNLNTESGAANEDNINIPDWDYDKAGHIISKQNHKYTLPFGFKTIRTNGRGSSLSENAKSNPSKDDIVANNTRDILNINSGNRWIRIDTTDNTEMLNSLTISHDIHETPHDDKDDNTTDWTKTEKDTTIPTVTYQFDEAGHYISHHIEKYQLPFGYGKIKGDSGSTAASATYDELSFITTDKWLSTFVDKDSVSFSHDFTPVDDTYPTSNKNNDEGNGTNKGIGDTLKLYTPIVDEKGHIVGKNTETVTLPYSYKTFTGDSGSSSANNTQGTMAVTGDNWIQTAASNNKIAFTHIGPVIGTATAENNVTPAFGDTFVIKDHYFDSKGHKFESKEHTVKIPIPSLTNGNGNVVTGLSLVPSAGALSESKANLGTIKLGTYEAGDNSEDVTADITLQQALSRLTNKIANEVTNRTNAINALEVPDSAVDGQYVSAVSEANGKISVSRKDLPVYTLASGSTNGTVAFNGTDVAVKGLGSAAYTSSSNYATAAQGTNADSALELIAELQRTIQSLEARIAVLEAYHPVVEEEEEITPTE